MTLEEIYSQIAIQSGIESVFTFSNSIPLCFKNAFTETLRIPKSKDSFQPYFEDEIEPLIEFESMTVGGSSGLIDIGISDLDYIPINVFDVVTGTNVINFKYVGFNEINDISANPNLVPSEGEGYWSKDGSRIRLLMKEGFLSNFEIVYLRNPDTNEWISTYDFQTVGYGDSFINSVIELAIEKLKAVAKYRGA